MLCLGRSTFEVKIFATFLFGNLLVKTTECFHSNAIQISHFRRQSSELRSASEFHTNYEYVARQKGAFAAECITWIDPSENIDPYRLKPTQKIGFQIDDDNHDHDDTQKLESNSNEKHLRLPIYPVSAVHLPSSATHTLHNTQTKNIKMSRDLKAGKWDIDFDFFCGTTRNRRDVQKKQCFVLTLFAQDTYRLASVGTLVEVISMEDTYTYDKKTLLRVVVKCRALGLVEINGFQAGTINMSDDYLVGKINLIQTGFEQNHTPKQMETSSDCKMLDQIIQDYEIVRDMYTNRNSVASSELPPYARDAVQSNMPSFSRKDFLSYRNFWNVADCYQMLCNTVRDARRSELQVEINEIMIEAASKKKGPLKLPIKRQSLPDDVQSRIRKMEQEESEDFLSSGLDPALDFQILLGMGKGRDIHKNRGSLAFLDPNVGQNIHMERIKYLATMIKKEKDRLEIKESLKDMFQTSSDESLKQTTLKCDDDNIHTGANNSTASRHFE